MASAATRLRGINLQLNTLAVSGTPPKQISGDLKRSTELDPYRVTRLDAPRRVQAAPFSSSMPASIDRTGNVAQVQLDRYRAPAIPSAGSLSSSQETNLENIGKRLKKKFFGSSAEMSVGTGWLVGSMKEG